MGWVSPLIFLQFLQISTFRPWNKAHGSWCSTTLQYESMQIYLEDVMGLFVVVQMLLLLLLVAVGCRCWLLSLLWLLLLLKLDRMVPNKLDPVLEWYNSFTHMHSECCIHDLHVKMTLQSSENHSSEVIMQNSALHTTIWRSHIDFGIFL